MPRIKKRHSMLTNESHGAMKAMRGCVYEGETLSFSWAARIATKHARAGLIYPPGEGQTEVKKQWK